MDIRTAAAIVYGPEIAAQIARDWEDSEPRRGVATCPDAEELSNERRAHFGLCLRDAEIAQYGLRMFLRGTANKEGALADIAKLEALTCEMRRVLEAE